MLPDNGVGHVEVIFRKLAGVLYILVSLVIAFLLDYLLWNRLMLDPLIAWLIAINLVAFLTYSFDDFISKTSSPRVSERQLIFHALVGGILGAYLGSKLYHHQSSLEVFKYWPAWLILMQFILVVLYMWLF